MSTRKNLNISVSEELQEQYRFTAIKLGKTQEELFLEVWKEFKSKATTPEIAKLKEAEIAKLEEAKNKKIATAKEKTEKLEAKLKAITAKAQKAQQALNKNKALLKEDTDKQA